MKKILVGLALAGMLLSVSSVAFADNVCPDSNPTCAANGPIQPQIPGGRFLSAGEEDCPWWFPQNFGHACYTMRPVGASFIH